jgi:hypothetical protein
MAKASLAIAIRCFTDCLRGQADREPAQGDQGAGQRGLIGPQRSAASVAAEPCASPAGASAGNAQPAPEGSGHRLGAGADALRPGPKGSECQTGAGLAMGVPPAEPLARQGVR